MSQEEGPPDVDGSLPTQTIYYATSTESEASDDVSEASDTALTGTPSILTGRKRRRRTIIAADQLMRMEQLYKQEQWPGRQKKEALARQIGMSTHFVNIWFQNKRSRMKKLAQEEEELEMLRKTRSPGTTQPKPDPVQSTSVMSKPITIAPKPPSSSTVSSLVSSNMSPISAVRIPRLDNVPLGQCLVVGQNININSGSGTVVSPALPGTTSVRSTPTVKMQIDNLRSRIKQPKIEDVLLQKPSTSVHPAQLPVTPQPIPTCNINQTQLPRQQIKGQLNFFKCLVSMMAMEEGGLLQKGDPEFDVAVNAALYGLRMANGNILTYRKKEGLFIHNGQH